MRAIFPMNGGFGIERVAAYRYYALLLLTSVYMLNLVDRGLMALLLQPIKNDLLLSDTQLGLVTGIAFGLFYAAVGVPLARWSDRGDRSTIAALSIGLWGLTVMAAPLITNYAQLVAARIAAAIGEAGCKPPTYSLVGDYFPEPAERTSAMAVYFSGSLLAALVSFGLGGWLNEQFGWRMAFFIVGIPGLILAAIVKLTLREPRRTSACALEATRSPPVSAVLARLWHTRSCRHLAVALVLLFTLGSGLGPWYAAFMIRTHHIGTAELGVWLGLIFGLCGVVGILGGGLIASRWFGGNEPGQLRLSALLVTLVVPCLVAFLLLPQKYAALIALGPMTLVSSALTAPVYTLLQRTTPDSMRATMLAVVMLFANLIGMGLGPFFVGLLSDLLAPAVGAHSLRIAMLIVSFVALWSGIHFWLASQAIRHDLADSRSFGTASTDDMPAVSGMPAPGHERTAAGGLR